MADNQRPDAGAKERIVTKENLETLNRSFVAAIRNREYFEFFQSVIKFLDDHFYALTQDGKHFDNYLFKNLFEAEILGKTWRWIELLYKNNKGPIKIIPGENESREEIESLQFRIEMKSILPEIEKDKDFERFCTYFRSRRSDQALADFTQGRDYLEKLSLMLADRSPKGEKMIQKTDPKKYMEAKQERLLKLKSILARGASQVICSNSDLILDLMSDASRTRRIPFLAGDELTSMDGQMQGWPSVGLTVILGSTSAGKTLCMSSLLANHCKMHLIRGTEERHAVAPVIWGYIGEDGVDEYTRRAACNIMNCIKDDYLAGQFGSFGLSEFNNRMAAEPEFKQFVKDEILAKAMQNCYWIKAPEDPEEKMNFSVLSLLNLWSSRIESGFDKPSFVIIDYFNLLHMPAKANINNRAHEMSMIAHMIDEWATQHGISVITAVQGSIGGVVGTRDMRHLEQEDLHESKSIAHHSRMLISLLPFDEYDEETGDKQVFMSIKVLKNRGGERGQVFVSDLNYAGNITFTNTKFYNTIEWSKYKANCLAVRDKVMNDGIEETSQAYGTKGKGDGKDKRQQNGWGSKKKEESKLPTSPIGLPEIKDQGSL